MVYRRRFLSGMGATISAALAGCMDAAGVGLGGRGEASEPAPPEDLDTDFGMYHNYDSIEFTYAYLGSVSHRFLGPAIVSRLTEEVVPRRVVLHTTDEITPGTRLHEYAPLGIGIQRHEVDLRALAENPDDHLRTHPEINLTVIYTNGARETVRSTGNIDLASLLKSSLSFSQDREEGTVTITPNDIIAERVTIEAANRTYTVERDEGRRPVTVYPEDYYVDTTGDGWYDTKERIDIVAHYKDVRSRVTATTAGFYEPAASISEGNEDGHIVLDVDSLSGHESVAIYTPGGEYILNRFYNAQKDEDVGDGESYVQLVEGVGDSLVPYGITIDERASEIKLFIEFEGDRYVTNTLAREDHEQWG